MNIIITGMRGTGKTKLGRLVAEKLGREFIDMDEKIEEETGKKISEMVEKHGWLYFRDLEKKMAKKIGELDNYIISTGGGTLMFKENIKTLKKNGIVILLKASVEKIKDRIKHKKRPSLTGKDFVLELQEVWEQRKAKYEKAADIIVDVTSDDLGKKRDRIIDEITKFQSK